MAGQPVVQGVATVVTQTRVADNRATDFVAWQQRMSAVVAEQEGFLSQELLPPSPPGQEDWVIIQRFSSGEHARAWLDSFRRSQMVAEIADALEGTDSVSVVVGGVRTPERAATAIIHTMVQPERRHEFDRWHAEITAAQSKWPGYVGSSLQPPIPGVEEAWTTLVTFDSAEHLDAWLGSDERQALIDRAEYMSRDTSTRTMSSGFADWFPQSGAGTTAAAPPWKFNYLILLGLYPIVMLEILFLNPMLDWTNVAFGNLIGNVLSVAILGWPVVALLNKAMRWWLAPASGRTGRHDAYGVAAVLVALAILVTVFYFIDLHVHLTPVTTL